MEPDFTGIGALLIGVAAVIGSVASFYMSIKNTKKIRDIDHAVNGKPEGAPTIQSQVSDLHSDRPAPVPVLEDAPVKEMLKLLVADLYERKENP